MVLVAAAIKQQHLDSSFFNVTTALSDWWNWWKKPQLSGLKQREKSSGSVLMRDDSTKHTLFCSLRFSLTRIYQIPSDEILSVMVMPGQNGDFIPATAWGETTSDPTQIRLRPPRWRMETWRKRITAITFGNGRKLISPHHDASSNTLFTISLEGICSRLCCEDPLN